LGLASKAKEVNLITLLMIVIGILFVIPGILYILEDGIGIALLPLSLAVMSIGVAIGLYQLKKIAWFLAIIIGIVGLIIYMADFANVNIESYIGAILCIMLLIDLVLVRKFYF
jgi:hypothetical protein